MKIDYYIINPTGNITVLVKTPVEESLQPSVASKIMEIEPTAEQVGFVTDKKLRMAGGEFCGNASLSAAVLYCVENSIDSGTVDMTVSGAESPVEVNVEKAENDSYSGSVVMPFPCSVYSRVFDINGDKKSLDVVDFGSITHIVTEEDFGTVFLNKAIREWCRDLKCECLGIMTLNEKEGTMSPLVYVPAVNTLFPESSCASGTTAAGIYLSRKYGKPVSADLRQPGGTLKIDVFPGSPPVLHGKAFVEKRSCAEITL